MATSSTPSAIQWLAQKKYSPSDDLQTQQKKLQATEPRACSSWSKLIYNSISKPKSLLLLMSWGALLHLVFISDTQASVTCSPSSWSSMAISCPCMCSSMYNSNGAHSMRSHKPWSMDQKTLHYSSHETTRKANKNKNPISNERNPAMRETKKSFKYCTTHFLNVCAALISNRLRTCPSLSQQKLPQMYINLIIVLFLLLHIVLWALHWKTSRDPWVSTSLYIIKATAPWARHNNDHSKRKTQQKQRTFNESQGPSRNRFLDSPNQDNEVATSAAPAIPTHAPCSFLDPHGLVAAAAAWHRSCSNCCIQRHGFQQELLPYEYYAADPDPPPPPPPPPAAPLLASIPCPANWSRAQLPPSPACVSSSLVALLHAKAWLPSPLLGLVCFPCRTCARQVGTVCPETR